MVVEPIPSGGGGGGGGGGAIIIATSYLSPTVTITVPGGAGGLDNGMGSQPGSPGSAGTTYKTIDEVKPV